MDAGIVTANPLAGSIPLRTKLANWPMPLIGKAKASRKRLVLRVDLQYHNRPLGIQWAQYVETQRVLDYG